MTGPTRSALLALGTGGVVHLVTSLVLGWKLATVLSLISVLLTGAAYVISYYEKPRFAMLLSLLGVNGACIYSAYAYNGVANVSVSLLPVLVMFASLLLDRGLLILVTGCVLTSTTGMVVLRWLGGIHPYSPNEAGNLVIVLSTVVLAAVIGHVLSAQLRTSTARNSESERRARTMAEALRTSEERWQLAVRGSNDGIWDWNAETGEVYVSERWKSMLGYSPEELEDSSRAWEQLVHPDDRERVRTEINAHLSGATELYQADYRMRAKDGSERWILARGRALWDAEGRAVRMTGSHTDITDRKRGEEMVHRAQQAAEAANRAKSEFLANMSHEVRTPMNAILGMALLLEKAEDEAERREYLELLTGCARSLLDLLTQVLDLSRIEAGRLELQSAPFQLRDCIVSSMQLFTAAVREKGLDLVLEIAPETPNLLIGDGVRLRQVLINLIGNAVKFTPSGSIRVVVRSQPRPEGGLSVEFSVTDEGIGIAAEKRRVIFEPFRQADGSATREHGGTGLGLAISSELVRAMGGQLWVESELGHGSTFRFSIISDEPAGLAGSGSSEDGSIECQDSLRGPAKILLVEDNPVNQKVAAGLLRRQGHEVRIAGDGLEAVRMVESEDFDLILMDLHMPRMNGFEATEVIRRRQRDCQKRTPIWALTAAAMDGDRERSLRSGMDGFLTKPVELRSLLLVVGSIELGATRSRRAMEVQKV